MEEKSPRTTRSLFTRWLIFHRSRPLASWLIMLGVCIVFSSLALVSAGVVGYMAYDYTQNDPEFCITCHVPMQEAYDTWKISEHAEVTCHTCHHLSPEEAVNYGIHLMRGLPTKVPPRHEGEIIVPSAYCMDCHWEAKKSDQVHTSEEKDITDLVVAAGHEVREFLSETGPKGPNVAASRYHAIHYFKGNIECLSCHGGYKELHVFTLPPEACIDCHEDQQEKIHSSKGFEQDCLNCHTDRTVDLVPDREKCLVCHAADEAARQELMETETLDVRHTQISEEIIAKATKINAPENAPMLSFACSTCHTPHQSEARPSVDICLSCHPRIEDVGQHTLHLKFVKSDCMNCHKVHTWAVTEEQAQKECVKCHELYDPLKFIQAQ